jgi:hypothetical protein
LSTFQITFSAVDKVTATAKRINASMDKITKPISAMKKSMQALGSELGVDQLSKSITSVADSATDLGKRLGRVAAPMAAIFGISSVASVAALAVEWAHLGSEVGRTAASIGISTGNLVTLRGAAKLAGLSADDLTGGMHSLATTMQNAKYGRDNDALTMMRTIGMTAKTTKAGVIDVNAAFMDLADIISSPKYKDNPLVQSRILQGLHVDGMGPLLRQGSGAIQEAQARYLKFFGVISDDGVRAADSFRRSMVDLDFATGGLRNTLGEKLAPILQPMLDRFNNWVALNREWIATKITAWVERLALWVGKIDFAKLGNDMAWVGGKIAFVIDKVATLIEKLGGLKAIAIAVGAILTANLAGSLVGLAASIGRIGTMVALVLPLGRLATAIVALVAAVYAIKSLSSSSKAETPKGGASGDWDEPGRGGASGDWEDAPGAGRNAKGSKNNNPGNLRRWSGMPSKDGFAVFPTVTAGLDAMIQNLLRYSSAGVNSIAGVVSKWSPPSENNTSQLISNMSARMHTDPNASLNMRDPSVLAPMVSALIKQEGNSGGLDEKTIRQHVSLQLSGLPAGMTVTASAQDGSHVPVRTSRFMDSLN